MRLQKEFKPSMVTDTKKIVKFHKIEFIWTKIPIQFIFLFSLLHVHTNNIV